MQCVCDQCCNTATGSFPHFHPHKQKIWYVVIKADVDLYREPREKEETERMRVRESSKICFQVFNKNVGKMCWGLSFPPNSVFFHCWLLAHYTTCLPFEERLSYLLMVCGYLQSRTAGGPELCGVKVKGAGDPPQTLIWNHHLPLWFFTASH